MLPRPWTGLALGTLTAALVAGCLSAFAPPLRTRARPHHEALRPDSSAQTCMGCHRSEAEALADPQPADAPLVADWMLADARGCLDCHRLRGSTDDR